MKDKIHYNLYCLNQDCRVSIYQRTSPLQLEMNIANLLAVHPCKLCGCKLVSTMDMQINEIAPSAGIELPIEILPFYLN